MGAAAPPHGGSGWKSWALLTFMSGPPKPAARPARAAPGARGADRRAAPRVRPRGGGPSPPIRPARFLCPVRAHRCPVVCFGAARGGSRGRGVRKSRKARVAPEGAVTLTLARARPLGFLQGVQPGRAASTDLCPGSASLTRVLKGNSGLTKASIIIIIYLFFISSDPDRSSTL